MVVVTLSDGDGKWRQSPHRTHVELQIIGQPIMYNQLFIIKPYKFKASSL